MVDTLAAPVGGERQFRYDQKWVDPALRDLVSRRALPAEARCLLCFVDLRGKPQTPFILPLREAVLDRVIAAGTTYTLVFRLGAFRSPVDIRAFSDSARKALPDLHRFHKVTGAQEPTGYLWTDAGDKLDSEVRPAATDGENWLLTWEEIVRNYVGVMKAPEAYSKDLLDADSVSRDDQRFQDKSPFYVFYELQSLPTRNCVTSTAVGGRQAFRLAPGCSYELSFYQYHPTSSFHDVGLKLATGESNIKFTGTSELKFDTRYDIKRFTFSTADVLTGFGANMLVSRVFHKEDESIVEDFDLNLDVEGSKLKMALYTIAIAAAFAIPQFLTLAKASPSPGASSYVVVLIAAAALGVLAGMKDAFKLK